MDLWIPTGQIFRCCENMSSSHAHKHGVQVLAIDIHEMNYEYQDE